MRITDPEQLDATLDAPVAEAQDEVGPGTPNVYCTHTAHGRYAAVFWSDELQLYAPGSEEMTPGYTFDWWKQVPR